MIRQNKKLIPLGIALTGNFTGTHPKAGSATGSGTRYIDLVPLEDGCDG